MVILFNSHCFDMVWFCMILALFYFDIYRFFLSVVHPRKMLFRKNILNAAHLQDLWVVVHLPLVAAFSCRGGALGEVAAFVQEEQRFSIFFLQSLQLSSVLSVDGGLGR